MVFTKWTLLKIFEVIFTTACLITKKVTDDEANRLFLYLQKLSREWSLLNNVTWDRVGSAVADTTYGGYIVITGALLIGNVTGELPTTTRVSEMVMLGIGALLFVVLGSLEFAALDSVPPDLVDNAAVLGTLSLVTAALFLLDLGGPKAKAQAKKETKQPIKKEISQPLESPKRAEVVIVETEKPSTMEESLEELKAKISKDRTNGFGPILTSQNGFKASQNGYKKMKERESPRTFGIYGKDVDEPVPTGEKSEQHSPVWSQIRKGQYGKYDVVVPPYLYPEKDFPLPHHEPSSPSDPGYVQYTAKKWGQQSQKTPRHSPTQV